MSAAAQVVDINSADSKGKSKKKLIIIAAAVLVLAGGGAGGFFWWQQKNAHGESAAEAKEAQLKAQLAAVPVFLPLEALVVNLAGRDGERLAQVGITLQVVDAKTADLIKLHMPSIRSGILLTVAHHSAEELLLPEGKDALAVEIMRQVLLPLGIDPETAEPAKPGAHGEAAHKPGKAAQVNPVQKVLFSSLIIQ